MYSCDECGITIFSSYNGIVFCTEVYMWPLFVGTSDSYTEREDFHRRFLSPTWIWARWSYLGWYTGVVSCYFGIFFLRASTSCKIWNTQSTWGDLTNPNRVHSYLPHNFQTSYDYLMHYLETWKWRFLCSLSGRVGLPPPRLCWV